MDADRFNPYELLGTLERSHVAYIVIGGIARVLHGSYEISRDLDVCPSGEEANRRRLQIALERLNARELDPTDPLVANYDTDHGQLSVVFAPTGIARGYEGLRRQADREALGQGLRPYIAGVPDLIRNLENLGRDRDISLADQLRTITELERSLGLGRGHGMSL